MTINLLQFIYYNLFTTQFVYYVINWLQFIYYLGAALGFAQELARYVVGRASEVTEEIHNKREEELQNAEWFISLTFRLIIIGNIFVFVNIIIFR